VVKRPGRGDGRRGFLALVSWCVPADRREAWELEWRAELANARMSGGSRARVWASAAEDAVRMLPARLRSADPLGDLRHAVRSLGRNPTFAVTALLTLGLGIGANTAIYSVIRAYLLTPLPLPSPERVVVLLKDGRSTAGATSAPDFVDWRSQSQSFEDLAAVHLWSANLVGGEIPLRVTRARVTPSLFGILGVKPLLGRDFAEDDAIPGRDRVVILSYDLWMSAFGGARDILGRTLRIDGVDCTVIGVGPRALRIPPITTQIWVPLPLDADAMSARGRNNLYVIGRLSDGVSLEAAGSEMRLIGNRIAEAYPAEDEGRTVTIQTLHDFALGPAPGGLWRLQACVGLVLLIACVNVANLVIARGVARERELAVRVSLGASRARLIGPLLAESAVLGAGGGVIGLLLARAALDPIRGMVPESLAAFGEVSLDVRLLVITLTVSVASGLAAGLLPALRLTTTRKRPGSGGVFDALRVRGGTARLRAAFAIAQYALATVLLVVSILVVRSLENLYDVDVGIRYDGVTTFGVTFPEASFAKSERVIQGVAGVLEGVRSSPGVEVAGAVSHLPLTGSRLTSSVLLEGGPGTMTVNGPSASIKVVTPEYFNALGVRLVEGRYFRDADREGSEPVAIINHAAAVTFWPGEDPIGRWIAYADGPDGGLLRRRIVGVVGDIRYAGPSAPAIEEVYEPYGQTTEVWRWFGRSMSFVVRTADGSILDVRDARAAVARVDAALPVTGYGPLAERLDRALATPRFHGALLGAFGVLAIVLASVGLYGVLAFTVRRRTRELGIRLALGAQKRVLLAAVLGDALRLAAVGGTIGVAGAALLGRFLRALLWGVEPADPLTMLVVLALLTLSALLASWIPARRAASVDPVLSLQAE
jgi:putative ABC transport system permease protein